MFMHSLFEISDDLLALADLLTETGDDVTDAADALLKAEIDRTEVEVDKELVTLKDPKRGRPNKLSKLDNLLQTYRARRNGVGRQTQMKLDYLATHDEALLAAVQTKTLSAHRAYQLARGIPCEAPVTTLYRIWHKVSPEDQARFLIEMLTPAQRLLISTGLMDEESTP